MPPSIALARLAVCSLTLTLVALASPVLSAKPKETPSAPKSPPTPSAAPTPTSSPTPSTETSDAEEVAGVIPATDVDFLLLHVGQFVTIEGTVVKSSASKSGMQFLNFKNEIRTGFVAVIYPRDMKNFPDSPKDYYLEKTVRIRGVLAQFRTLPQIVLTSAKQIEIVK